MQTPTNLFEYQLEVDSVRHLQVQMFDNGNNITIKLSLMTTKTKGNFKTNFMFDLPKLPNRPSIDSMVKRFPNLDFTLQLQSLLSNTTDKTIYSQCRSFGSRNTYYKMCDVALTPHQNYLELNLTIFGKSLFFKIQMSQDDVDKLLTKTTKQKASSFMHITVSNNDFDTGEIFVQDKREVVKVQDDVKTIEKPKQTLVQPSTFTKNGKTYLKYKQPPKGKFKGSMDVDSSGKIFWIEEVTNG
jgi:hypothetical protein